MSTNSPSNEPKSPESTQNPAQLVKDTLQKLESLADDDTIEGLEELQAEFSKLTIPLFSAYGRDATTGFDLYQTAKQITDEDDRALYSTLLEEYDTNDLAQFLVHRLVNRLLDIRFTGDAAGRQKILDFFSEKDTVNHLRQMLVQAFVLGTGILQRFGDREALRNVVRLDAETVDIGKDQDPRQGNIRHQYRQEYQSEKEGLNGETETRVLNLRASRIAAFRPMEKPDSPYGVSYMRASLLALQAVRQLLMDIPAGIKRLAYALLVMKIDLQGVKTLTDARTRIKMATASFAKFDAATSTVIGIDRNNELKYVGSDGGSVPTIIPILPILEPILIPLLNKWHVPLGIFLQDNSNRALSETQASEAEREVRALQQRFALFLEREVVPYILNVPEGKPSPVRVTHNVNLDDQKDELELYVKMYEKTIIPREAIISRFGIDIPEGELHYYTEKGSGVWKAGPGGALPETGKMDHDLEVKKASVKKPPVSADQ